MLSAEDMLVVIHIFHGTIYSACIFLVFEFNAWGGVKYWDSHESTLGWAPYIHVFFLQYIGILETIEQFGMARLEVIMHLFNSFFIHRIFLRWKTQRRCLLFWEWAAGMSLSPSPLSLLCTTTSMMNVGVYVLTPTSPPLTSKKPLLSGFLGQTWKRSNATFCEIYSHQILV